MNTFPNGKTRYSLFERPDLHALGLIEVSQHGRRQKAERCDVTAILTPNRCAGQRRNVSSRGPDIPPAMRVASPNLAAARGCCDSVEDRVGQRGVGECQSSVEAASSRVYYGEWREESIDLDWGRSVTARPRASPAFTRITWKMQLRSARISERPGVQSPRIC